jgi:hypothetical protein
MDEKQMTKTEARAFIKRAREALREMDRMLDQGGTADDWADECLEASGSVAALLAPVDNGFGNMGPGIKGIEVSA